MNDPLNAYLIGISANFTPATLKKVRHIKTKRLILSFQHDFGEILKVY